MAFNQLKKWVGTQLWSTFMTEYNENIDELNRVIAEFQGNIAEMEAEVLWSGNLIIPKTADYLQAATVTLSREVTQQQEILGVEIGIRTDSRNNQIQIVRASGSLGTIVFSSYGNVSYRLPSSNTFAIYRPVDSSGDIAIKGIWSLAGWFA